MIKVGHLTKRYGHQAAVQDISFEIDRGEVVGFLGPNGAGKSTTMNILTGYISSTAGDVTINGHDILEEPNEAKKSIGYLPEIPPLYTNMTVAEYLSFVYDLKKASSKGKNKKEHIGQVCEMVQVTHVKDRLISNLSKGYKQRVGLAQALLGDPEVLILDEPTVGLDPQQIIEIRNLITELGKTHTIILSTHILTEVQSICDRIIIINKGKIVADDTEENLAHSLSSTVQYTLRLKAEREQAEQLLSGLDGIDEIIFDGSKEDDTVDFRIIPTNRGDIRISLFELMAENNVPILEMTGSKLTLEQVFLKLLAQDQAEEYYEDIGKTPSEDETGEGAASEEDGETTGKSDDADDTETEEYEYSDEEKKIGEFKENDDFNETSDATADVEELYIKNNQQDGGEE